jgi:DNA-binding SARP family transcriptional activator
VRLNVLGPMTVDGVGRLQRRDRTVLAVLLLSHGSVVTGDELADAVWGETPPPSCRKILQGSVVRLRRALGASTITTLDGGYLLRLADDAVDAWCFATELARAHDLLGNGFAVRAYDVAAEALTWWRGEPLTELREWPPARAEAERLRGLREQAEDLLVEARLIGGLPGEAATLAQALSERAPLRESRWALWARALYAEGRQSDALAVIARLRTTLRDELGIDVNPDVALLEQAVLRQDRALEIAPWVISGSRCPWPGLRAYQQGDALFGRDNDLDEALQRLARSKVLVVIGASGCGKSSFVRASLSSRINASIVTPGRHPLDVLASAPEGPLIVDQVEEVLTYEASAEDREAFFDALASRPHPVVLVARGDLLDGLAEHSGFAALLDAGLFVLRPLSVAGLRTMIEASARHAELRLEPGLVDVLLAESADQPAALPLLSHALAQTWQRIEGNLLTVAGYRQTGGVSGAVSTSAERIYTELSAEGQDEMRRLFLRLVHLEGDVPVRGRFPRSWADGPLVERLLAERLVSVVGEADLVLAHEALVSHWPRLTAWLAEDETGQRLMQRLASDAQAWDTDGRPIDLLYRGVRLGAVSAWAATRADDLAAVERDFLEASASAGVAELRHVRRNNARLRVALIASGALLVLAAAGGALAYLQARRAEDARLAAVHARDVSESLRLGGVAETVPDSSAAFALAVEALALDDSEATRAHVLRVFARFPALLATGVSPSQWSWPDGVAASVRYAAATSPDGRLGATASFRQVTVRRTRSGKVVTTIQGVPTRANALAFDRVGRLLAGGLSDPGLPDAGTTLVWDVATGVEVGRFRSGDGPVWGHRFSPDGKSVYAYGADGLHRWDLSGSTAVAAAASGEAVAFRAGSLLFSLTDRSVAPWISEACRLAGRALTQAEWTQYVGNRPYRPSCS